MYALFGWYQETATTLILLLYGLSISMGFVQTCTDLGLEDQKISRLAIETEHQAYGLRRGI
jgi:hypothetical protein